MSRLINADEFAKRLNDSLSEYCNAINLGMSERFGLLLRVSNAFYEQPTIDAPVIESAHVVHAHWMRYEVDVAEHPWHCSRCGGCPPKHVMHIEDMEYCSNCGAKMDEKIGEQNES